MSLAISLIYPAKVFAGIFDQDFRSTRKFVIPAKAGIQAFQRLTGFPPTRE